jgi:hypothetical protein
MPPCMGGIIRDGPGIWPIGCFIPADGIPGRMPPGPTFSDDAGEAPKPSVVVGDAACDEGVGRDLGDPAGGLAPCIGGS